MTTRQQIWQLTQDVELIQRAKSKIKTDPSHPEYWEAVKRRVEELLKPRKKPVKRTALSDELKQRYRAAKLKSNTLSYPLAIKDGHFIEPDYPNVGTSAGLQEFIINLIMWDGFRATRINVMGRMVNGKYIRSATRTGSADVSSTINGKSVMWEIKIGSDRPSPDQLKEQQRERKAGGEYFFVKTAEEFIILYDQIKGLF